MLLSGMSRAWAAVLLDEGSGTYLTRIGISVATFAVLYGAGLAVAKAFPSSAIASRPSVIYGTVHSVAVSCVALASISGLLPLSAWTDYGLPCSMGYFLFDTLACSLPKRDVGMLAHHLVTFAVHVPVGVASGALITGAGNATWAIQVSALTYLCEVPVPLLNVRWYMLKTLKKHSPWYTLNNALLLLLYSGTRLGMIAWSAFTILPRRDEFAAANSSDIVGVFLVSHAAIFAMSGGWLAMLLSNGLRSFLTFTPGEATHKRD